MNALLYISLFFLEFPAPSVDTMPSARSGLPPEPQLYAALDSFYSQQTQAELAEFQSTNKKQWLKFLPTVGISYTLDGKPRPTVSWSSNLIYTSHRNKESRQAKQLSIIRKNELERQKAKLRLHALIQKHHALQQDIAFMKKLLEYDTQFYEVKKDQAAHLEISPTDLLKAEQQYQKKRYDIFQKGRTLLELEWEILIHAHYNNH